MKNLLKKLSLFVIAAIMAISFVSCDNDEGDHSYDNNNDKAEENVPLE